MQRTQTGIAFFFWAGIILTVYYVVQRPDLNRLAGLVDTAWTLIVAAILLFNSYGAGTRILDALGMRSNDATIRLLLGSGIGMGALGLLGLSVSALQIARAPVLAVIQIGLAALFVFSSDVRELRKDLKVLYANLHLSFSQYGLFARIALLLPFTFSFLLTLVPPFEAFDALLYHLAQPATILRDGGLRALDNAPFWFPNITENVYLWALALRSERAAQMLHLAWGVLAALLLWHWSTKTWGIEIGRKTLLLLAAIPALPMLASWAYADMALVYFAVATLYALTSYQTAKSPSLLVLTGVLAGLAMGVKYTSFVLPLSCGLLLLFQRPFAQAFKRAAQFSIVALLVALPWYARNAIVMGNPFYPFVFGGRYWDAFLSEWYAGAGTGIGWDIFQIFILPLNTVLGHRDATFFDGRIGPIFLILLPVTLWILLTAPRRDSAQTWSLISISLFSFLSFAAWTFGVVNSSALWQARLLLPALIPFAIPTALGWDSLRELDIPKLRISFIADIVIALVIALTVFENGIFVLQRNPLAVAFGAQSREQYIRRIVPSYSALMQDLEALPADAKIYSLFEPRSYDLPRQIQPDPLVTNFAHDLHIHKSPAEIIAQWQEQGYTHILVYESGMQFMLDNNIDYRSPSLRNALSETLSLLQLIHQTQDQVYSIYKIP